MNWLIHIGAHKTATTHIQDSLASASLQLSETGILFIPRAKSRPLLRQGLHWARRPRRFFLNIYRLRRQLARVAYEQSCKSLLLSEENLLGSAADSLKYPLYPRAELGLSFLNQLKRKDHLRLLLCIRGFDSVAPGAYATALRFKDAAPEDKARYIKSVKQQPPRWVNLIERLLRSAPPNVELKVWRYEDYRNNREFVLESLVGDAAPLIPNLPPPKETVTPSKKGFRLPKTFSDIQTKMR